MNRMTNARRAHSIFTCLCLCSAVLWISGLHGLSATYYVDFSAGSDAAAGTSPGMAWKHCPGDANATSTAADALLAGGDTVYFKGGVRYRVIAPVGYIRLKWSGTSGNPITYDGNSAGTWGSGKAIITDTNSPNSGSIAFAAVAMDPVRSNLVFRGFNITQIGGAPSLPANPGSPIAANNGHGFYFENGLSDMVFDGIDFSELGYWFNAKPMDLSNIGGNGILMRTLERNITITNCTFSKLCVGVSSAPSLYSTNVNILNCSFFTNISKGVDCAVASTNVGRDYFYVHGCTFFNFHQFNANYWTGYEAPHVEGIFFRGNYNAMRYGPNCSIYNNVFYFNANPGGGTACIYVSFAPFCNIYNNVFVNTGFANGSIAVNSGSFPGSGSNFLNIVNNTFYGGDSAHIICQTQQGVAPPKNVQLLNNIFYTEKAGVVNVLSTSPSSINYPQKDVLVIDMIRSNRWTVNYNVWRKIQAAPTTTILGLDPGTWTWFNMQANGWELNGMTNNPVFLDIAPGLNAWPNLNLRLAANSPAIGKGTNLTEWNLQGLTWDKDGKLRSTVGAWTMGAYESIEASGAPVLSLVASGRKITAGEVSTLTWASVNATNLTLSGFGQVPLNGSTNVSPIKSTKYTATAIGANGTNSVSVLILLPPSGLLVSPGN